MTVRAGFRAANCADSACEAAHRLAGRPGPLSIIAAAATRSERGPSTSHLTPRPSKHHRLVSPMRELERDSLPSPLSADLPGGRWPWPRGRLACPSGRGSPGSRCASPRADARPRPPGRGRRLALRPGRGDRRRLRADRGASPPPAGRPRQRCDARSTPCRPAARGGAATFSLHPLQTFADDDDRRWTGTPARSRATMTAAVGLRPVAGRDGSAMRPFEVPEESRAAYHAAAAIASNLLVALEESAAELLERAGIEDARELLAPLVLRTAANWAERGPDALTGPIARGDEATVERHRAALAETAPELLPMYDALAERAEAIAARASGRRGRMKIVRTKARAARGARRAAPRGQADRPRPDDGLLPRGPSVADAGGARGLRPGRGEPLRQPDPVRAGRGPRRLSARRGPRRGAGRTRGRRPALDARRRRDVPEGFATSVEVGQRAHRRARGRSRRSAAPPTSAASPRSSPSSSTASSPTSPTSGERTPSRPS